MAITDFNKKKALDVASVTGTPTVSRAVPIKITSGNDSTTGTGDIVLDWTNISSKADIGVYDENDNLLDYYFESFDATAETAVIWVYRAWDRDGTTQAQIAYGNGPSDQSVVASTVFDKETDLDAGYLLNESSGDALDVTSNNNDGTVSGATQGATGIVNGAYDFDGDGDYIDIGDNASIDYGAEDFSLLAWFKLSDTTGVEAIIGKSGDADDKQYRLYTNGDALVFDYEVNNNGEQRVTVSSALDTNWTHAVARYTQSSKELRVFINSTSEGNTTGSYAPAATNFSLQIGAFNEASKRYINGLIDNVRIYGSALSSDEITADYAATKSSPTFFSQQAGEQQVTFTPRMMMF